MTQNVFDVRTHLRDTIGYAWIVDNVEVSTVSVTNDVGDDIYIPLFLPGDVRTGDLPRMPFIEMTLVNAPSRTENIGGDTKFNEAYFDFNIYYANADDISMTTFGTAVADTLMKLIHTYRTSVTSAYFVEVLNSGREIIENYNNGVVFHRVLECYANNYNR